MLRWMLIILLAMLLINGLRHWLERIGLGRLPGDFHFRLFGREWFMPIGSTVVLSFIASMISLVI